MIKLIFNIAKLQVKILVNRNISANSLSTSFTNTSKRDIMFSEKTEYDVFGERILQFKRLIL